MKTTPHLSTARHQTAAWGGCRAGPWTSAVDMAISKRNRRPIDCSCDARGNAPTAQQRPSNGPAPTLRGHGAYSYQTVPRQISRHGAISGTGRRRSIAASIGASGCRRTGNRNGMRVADRGWKRRFEEPIPLPRGRQLVTLEEAGNYITKLPKAEHEAQECGE